MLQASGGEKEKPRTTKGTSHPVPGETELEINRKMCTQNERRLLQGWAVRAGSCPHALGLWTTNGRPLWGQIHGAPVGIFNLMGTDLPALTCLVI